MTAASAVFDDLIQFPGFGLKITVSTSSAAATATSTSPLLARFQNQTTFFEGKYLFIPSAAAADDQVRSIKSHSYSTQTTTLSFDDTTNYNETLNGVAGYILVKHPSDILDAMNTGLERLKFTEMTPLAHGPDSYDMQGSSVDSDWTESGATDTVQTTASEVLMGAQSLVVTDSGSGGDYTESSTLRVGQGKAIQAHLLAKSDTGTSELQIIDGSSNEQGDITFTEEQWVYGTKRVQFDAADETFTLRLAEITASASGDYQGAWVVRQGEYRFNLPSWIADRFTIRGLVCRHYVERADDSGSSDQLYLAYSYEDELLFEGHHYQVYKLPNAAHTRVLEILGPGRAYMDKPLFLSVQHPWSAPWGVSTTFTSYTATSDVPQDLITAKTMQILGERNSWPDMEERGTMKLEEVYFEDEREQTTMPDPQPWAGPLGGIVL